MRAVCLLVPALISKKTLLDAHRRETKLKNILSKKVLLITKMYMLKKKCMSVDNIAHILRLTQNNGDKNSNNHHDEGVNVTIILRLFCWNIFDHHIIIIFYVANFLFRILK